MRGLERLGDLPRDRKRLVKRQPLALSPQPFELPPFYWCKQTPKTPIRDPSPPSVRRVGGNVH